MTYDQFSLDQNIKNLPPFDGLGREQKAAFVRYYFRIETIALQRVVLDDGVAMKIVREAYDVSAREFGQRVPREPSQRFVDRLDARVRKLEEGSRYKPKVSR